MPADAIAQGYVVLRITLGLIFLVSSLAKLRALQRFIEGVVDYHVLPSSLAQLYGRLLPLVELAVGILLTAGVALPVASVVAILLLTSFGVAMGINIVRGRRIDCHCFGVAAAAPIGWPAVARDAVLLALAIPVTWAAFLGGVTTAFSRSVPQMLVIPACSIIAVFIYFLVEQWAGMMNLDKSGS
jgi:hypothetical protein